MPSRNTSRSFYAQESQFVSSAKKASKTRRHSNPMCPRFLPSQFPDLCVGVLLSAQDLAAALFAALLHIKVAANALKVGGAHRLHGRDDGCGVGTCGDSCGHLRRQLRRAWIVASCTWGSLLLRPSCPPPHISAIKETLGDERGQLGVRGEPQQSVADMWQ